MTTIDPHYVSKLQTLTKVKLSNYVADIEDFYNNGATPEQAAMALDVIESHRVSTHLTPHSPPRPRPRPSPQEMARSLRRVYPLVEARSIALNEFHATPDWHNYKNYWKEVFLLLMESN